jgi:hypothetical protein
MGWWVNWLPPYPADLDALEMFGGWMRHCCGVQHGTQPPRVTIGCVALCWDTVAEQYEKDYWQDNTVEGMADQPDFTRGVWYLLLLSNMFCLSTTCCLDAIHVRRGVLDLRDANRWLSKPKERILSVELT